LQSWKKLLLLILPISFLLNSCSNKQPSVQKEPEVIIKTKVIEKNIPIQARPKGLKLNKNITWYVITPDTIDAFNEKINKEQGKEWVFYAIEVKDYERLSLNVAEIRRYIIQQKNIIEYYENSVQDNVTQKEN
tara:strand:- start:355 stop:753 length:399 start_codon:yes stop_codon:yes gene_type:complete